MKVKAGQKVVDAIKLAYRANKPVLLEGPHGIGKSELLVQAARELNISVIVQDLSVLDPSDILGLPVQENGRTKWAYPSWLPSEGAGLLVFEEISRAPAYVQNPTMNLLTSRKLGDFTLGEKWLPVAAGNPTDGTYNTAAELDPALRSRFIVLTVEPDVKAWVKWADSAQVSPEIIRFVASTEDIFAASCPRSWKYCSDIIKSYQDSGCDDESLLTTMLAGQVGDSLAIAFVTSMGQEAPIPADTLLKQYGGLCATVKHWTATKRTDLLNNTAHAVMVALQSPDIAARVSASDTEKTNLESFITDLPADMARKLRKSAKEAEILS